MLPLDQKKPIREDPTLQIIFDEQSLDESPALPTTPSQPTSILEQTAATGNSIAQLLQRTMQRLEDVMQRQSDRAERTGVPLPENVFSHELVSLLSGLISKLTEMLWLYCDHTHTSRYDILERVLAHQADPPLCRLIDQSDDCLILWLPSLPHRSVRGFTTVTESLAVLLYQTPSLPKWPRWECSFVHVFPASHARMPKDVDNYAYKRVIDVLSFAMGVSDGAGSFSLSTSTVFTDEIARGVYVLVEPKSSENQVFQKIKNRISNTV